MNVPSLAAFFDHSTSLQVTWLLLHFLWQGFAIAAVVFIVNYFASRSSASLRCGVAVAGLLAMIACVAATWFTLRPAIPAMDTATLIAAYELDPTIGMTPGLAVDIETPKPNSTLEVWAPAAALMYAIGVGIMLFRLVFSAVGVGRMRWVSQQTGDELAARLGPLSKKIGLRVKPALQTCARVVVPFVAGVIKPTILLPSSLATGLTQDELDAILLHELAHIRRGDLLVNLLQRIAESLLFFHPCVWYVSRVIAVERENCCDDMVLGHCTQKVYASALIRLAELCMGNSGDITPVAALAATGASPSQLKRRVMRILGVAPSPQLHRPGFGVLLACVVAVSITAVHLQADTKDGTAKKKTRPLTMMIDEESKLAEFTADTNSMQRLTAILQKLSENENVVINSTKIARKGNRLTMTVSGGNLDFSAIRGAVNRADKPQVMKATAELESEGSELVPTSAHVADEERVVQGQVLLELDDTLAGQANQNFRERTQEKLMQLRLQVKELESRYGPKHPRRKMLTKKLLEKKIAVLEEDLVRILRETEERVLNEAKSLATTGPIRFELFGDNQFSVKGDKEDVTRVMKLIEKVHAGRKPSQKSKESPASTESQKSKDLPPVFTGPVRIEFLEGTDIFIVRGKKEDVDRIMKVVGDPKKLDDNAAMSDSGDQKPSVNDGSRVEPKLELDDTIPSDPVDLKAYQLRYLAAESFSAELSEWLQARNPKGLGANIKADAKTNSVLVHAARSVHEDISRFLQEREKSAADPKYLFVYPKDEPVKKAANAINNKLDEALVEDLEVSASRQEPGARGEASAESIGVAHSIESYEQAREEFEAEKLAQQELVDAGGAEESEMRSLRLQRERLEFQRKQLAAAMKASQENRDSYFSEIVELKNKILATQAPIRDVGMAEQDGRRKYAVGSNALSSAREQLSKIEAAMESVKSNSVAYELLLQKSLELKDFIRSVDKRGYALLKYDEANKLLKPRSFVSGTQVNNARRGPGALRFPIEVERAMMGDASGRPMPSSSIISTPELRKTPHIVPETIDRGMIIDSLENSSRH